MQKNIEMILREKLRFPLAGLITAEDVYDLPLKDENTKRDLNTLAKNLNQRIKSADTEDFVGGGTVENEADKAMFEFVKYVIEIKKVEQEAEVKRGELKRERERLLRLYAQKADEEDDAKSKEEIADLLAENEAVLTTL